VAQGRHGIRASLAPTTQPDETAAAEGMKTGFSWLRRLIIGEGNQNANRKTLIYVNNRLEGNALLTIAGMWELSNGSG